MQLLVCAVSDPPDGGPALSQPVTVDAPSTMLLSDIPEMAFGPDVRMGFHSDCCEIWLRRRNGRFFEDCRIPWIIRPDGMLAWNLSANDVTLAELAATVEAGVLDADLDVLHFSWLEGRGDGEESLLSSWPTYHDWIVIWLSAAASVAAQCAARAIGKLWRQWQDRGARPRDWTDCMRAQTQWDAAVFATLNGMTTSEAVANLTVFGYVESEVVPGLYHFRPNERQRELWLRLKQSDDLPL